MAFCVKGEKVSAESDSGQDGRTEYRFYRGGELLFTKRLYAMYDKNWVEEPKFYYIDVTGDGEKDILAIVPVMMTGTGPLDDDMVMVYDVKGNAEIPVARCTVSFPYGEKTASQTLSAIF